MRDKTLADILRLKMACVKKQCGVSFSVSGVLDRLHQQGFSYKKPAPEWEMLLVRSFYIYNA